MKKLFFRIITIFITSVMFFSCTKKQSSTLNSAKTIRYTGSAVYFPLVIADKKGFFKEEFGDNVKLELNHQMNGGASAMEAMAAGDIDFAALGDMPVIQSKANGLDVRVLSSLFTSTKGYGLVAAKNSGINTVRDLYGKKVAVMSASTLHKLLLKYLEKENMSENDVEILFIKQRDTLAAFVGNNVDAAVSQVPYIQTLEEKTGAKQVLDATGYDTILTLIVGRGDFVEQNPEYTIKFLRAIIRANEWIPNHYEEAVSLVAEEDGNKREYEDIYYKTRTFKFNLESETINALQDTIDYLYAQKTIPTRLDANSFANPKFINSASKGL